MTEQNRAYVARIDAWRRKMEESLRADDGWLTVAGLFWLGEGANSLGADPESDIVLPPGSAPDHVGSFDFHGGQTTLHVTGDASVTVNGAPATTAMIKSDAEGKPDLVAIGDLTMLVIHRGQRWAIRLRDKQSQARRTFSGRRWFPIHESYCLTASFVPYDPPKPMPITNILGDTEQAASPGYVAFTLDGQEYRLDASPDPEPGLFLTFRDLTAGGSTYPAGRYLRTAAPQNGKVTLDFNQAYNPPCAFTAFATCNLPPLQNHLPIAIEAGELTHR